MTQAYAPIDLAGMKVVELADRVELKYLLTMNDVAMLLERLAEHYYILEIAEKRQFTYTTRYFDTQDLQLYRDHHNQYPNRVKVRQRKYEDTGDHYFEIKRKMGNRRTDKTRVPIPEFTNELKLPELALLNYPRIKGPLLPVLTNTFSRISLCDRNFRERVTIDTNMSVRAGSDVKKLDGIGLVEIKQCRYTPLSPAIMTLRSLHEHSTPFSKYATGVALLHPQVKQNNFKPVLLNLSKHGTK